MVLTLAMLVMHVHMGMLVITKTLLLATVYF